MSEWQDISTAPKDGTAHVRAMWVWGSLDGAPIRFEMNCGYVDEDGDFVSTEGDDFGWPAYAYEWWCPVPTKVPPPTRANLNEVQG